MWTVPRRRHVEKAGHFLLGGCLGGSAFFVRKNHPGERDEDFIFTGIFMMAGYPATAQSRCDRERQDDGLPFGTFAFWAVDQLDHLRWWSGGHHGCREKSERSVSAKIGEGDTVRLGLRGEREKRVEFAFQVRKILPGREASFWRSCACSTRSCTASKSARPFIAAASPPVNAEVKKTTRWRRRRHRFENDCSALLKKMASRDRRGRRIRARLDNLVSIPRIGHVVQER